MAAIHILPDLLINQIAAGEVVERPAAALKELLENSLDAGANTIGVQLASGGAKLLKISDDGIGIDRAELLLALARHATSKIATLDDLERIASLGFRGEALASIAAVSTLTLTSRTRDSNHAWSIAAEGGTVSEPRPAAHDPGTSVEVHDLYFNTPARRKFLKSEATEYAHCDEVFKRVALARPEIGFRLQHNGRAQWHLKAQNAAERITAVLGDEFAAATIAVDAHSTGLRLTGLAGLPAAARGGRDAQYFLSTAASCATKSSATHCARPTRTFCTTTAIRRTCCFWKSTRRASTSTCIRPKAKCVSVTRKPRTSSCSMR